MKTKNENHNGLEQTVKTPSPQGKDGIPLSEEGLVADTVSPALDVLVKESAASPTISEGTRTPHLANPQSAIANPKSLAPSSGN